MDWRGPRGLSRMVALGASDLLQNKLRRMDSEMVTTKYDDLSAAFDFVSFGAPFEHRAFVSRDTGAVYWISEANPIDEEDVPDDLETSDRYVAIPTRTTWTWAINSRSGSHERSCRIGSAPSRTSSGIGERTRVSRNFCHRRVVSKSGTRTKPRPRSRRFGIGARRMRFSLTRPGINDRPNMRCTRHRPSRSRAAAGAARDSGGDYGSHCRSLLRILSIRVARRPGGGAASSRTAHRRGDGPRSLR
jgi:hypothetical protein